MTAPLAVAAYRWDPATGRYRRPDGRFVTRAQIRAALDVAIRREAVEMREQLAALRRGTLSLDGWVLTMRQSVKMVHLWAAAAAKGGWAQLTQEDYGAVGQRLRFHYGRLQRFAGEIALGLPLDGRVEVRVSMYVEAARASYHDIERRVAIHAGLTEERNIPNPVAEHCADCVSLTGWHPIGTLPPIGTRTCLVRCKCRMDYR